MLIAALRRPSLGSFAAVEVAVLQATEDPNASLQDSLAKMAETAHMSIAYDSQIEQDIPPPPPPLEEPLDSPPPPPSQPSQPPQPSQPSQPTTTSHHRPQNSTSAPYQNASKTRHLFRRFFLSFLKYLSQAPVRSEDPPATNFSHHLHVTFNEEKVRFEGLPPEWESQLNKQFGLPLAGSILLIK